MPKLQVAPELLIDSLFKGATPGVRILGASFNPIHQVVELEIEGPGIPDVERISAVVSVERFAVRFEPKL